LSKVSGHIYKFPTQAWHGAARPVVGNGDGLHVWRVAVNILNKQSLTADKGWTVSLEVVRGANNS